MIPPPAPACPWQATKLKSMNYEMAGRRFATAAKRHPSIRRGAQVVRMIPPPAGLRLHERYWTRQAKRSLRRPLPHWSSDWPSASQQVVG